MMPSLRGELRDRIHMVFFGVLLQHSHAVRVAERRRRKQGQAVSMGPGSASPIGGGEGLVAAVQVCDAAVPRVQIFGVDVECPVLQGRDAHVVGADVAGRYYGVALVGQRDHIQLPDDELFGDVPVREMHDRLAGPW